MVKIGSIHPVAVRRAGYEEEQEINEQIQSLMRDAARERDEAAKSLAASDIAAYRRESAALIARAKGPARKRRRGAQEG